MKEKTRKQNNRSILNPNILTTDVEMLVVISDKTIITEKDVESEDG